VHEHTVEVTSFDRTDLNCFVAPAHDLTGTDVCYNQQPLLTEYVINYSKNHTLPDANPEIMKRRVSMESRDYESKWGQGESLEDEKLTKTAAVKLKTYGEFTA